MSCYSDTDLAPGMSPYTSLSSLTGSNIYSQSLSLLHPTYGHPHHTMSPRYGVITVSVLLSYSYQVSAQHGQAPAQVTLIIASLLIPAQAGGGHQ